VAVVIYAGSTANAEYTFTTLFSFHDTDGGGPRSGVIADASGNLFGTTEFGGANGYGTVFELSAGTNVHTILAESFDYYTSYGSQPNSLIADAGGNLYGTDGYGGPNGNGGGTVFKIAAGTHAFSTVAAFNGTNGHTPHSRLLIDSAGNLFGTTYEGGAFGKGTVFKLDGNTHAITTLVSFNGTNGSRPYGGLIADPNGNLYGTTRTGGANDVGTIFKIANDTNHTLSTLVTFNSTNGSTPFGDLIADSNGNIYGTTSAGGTFREGTIYTLDTHTSALTTLVSFNGANGAFPFAGLLRDVSGNLYGTTQDGGPNNFGTVFELEAGTNAIHTLATFDAANNPYGAYPVSPLINDSSGNLYGTTAFGGLLGQGTVFKLSPVPEPPTVTVAVIGFSLALFCKRSFRRSAHSQGVPEARRAAPMQ